MTTHISAPAGCCPINTGSVCWQNGASSGRANSIYDPQTETTTFLDQLTGDPVAANFIIACPEDQPASLTAQARLLGASTSWTPGADVVGTLTAVSFTVLTGTVNLTDQNGTAVNSIPAGATLSWGVDDRNTLLGPQSIATAAASSAIVHWVQRV